MKSFFKVRTVEEVLAIIGGFSPLEAESAALSDAYGRVTAEDVRAPEDVPLFDRSTMDGYAVRAADTFGATEGLPALFELIGEVSMGRSPDFELRPGQTARIWTGGMLPPGADAVVMLEYSRPVDSVTVELARPVAPWENIIRAAEDVAEGQILIPHGRRLRAQDLGLLAALGLGRVNVVRTPRVAIISTGDEIVPVEASLQPGQMRDVNSYTLAGLVRAAHAEPRLTGLIRDDPAALKKAVSQALDSSDVVIISGGSSVGMRDFTVEVFGSFPDSEILVHGVSVSPGKPTIMARVGRKVLWGLPGHTVSAMITCDLFVRPLLSRLSGKKNSGTGWGKTVGAVLARNVPSVHGRQDYVRVRLEENGDGSLSAIPLLGKSGLISTMVKADGLVCVGLNEEGLAKGVQVEVALF